MLKNFLSIVPENKNFISNNEGSAVAFGIGYFLATKKIPLIYLQNSGLGNAINPIISLASKKVWSIPMVLIIGWRGSYGIKDEPQHKQQGKVTEKFLKLFTLSRFFKFEPSSWASTLSICISTFSFSSFMIKLLPMKPRPPVTSIFI